jgi:competence protein ComEC
MPLLWVSVAFLTGLLAGEVIHLNWIVWIILACLFLTSAFLDPFFCHKNSTWHRLRYGLKLPAGVLLLFFALGGLRIWMADHPVWNMDDLAWYNDKGEIMITGWVSAAPDKRTDMTVYQVSAVEIEDPRNPDWVHATQKVSGLAQVRMAADSTWKYGDLLQFNATPQTPSASRDFSYRDYLAGFNIHTVIYHPQHIVQVGSGYGNRFSEWLIQLREKAHRTIFNIFPQPESGLLSGILLGMDNDLPESLAQAFRDTGVAHIIAISGFNMAVLAGLFLWVFNRPAGPYWGALVTVLLLILYTLFVNGSASVVRALIMAIVAAGGHLVGRRQEGLNALGFTAAVMCLVNPLLLNDISFQLSFAATFGLVVFAQPMQDGLKSMLEKRFSDKWATKLTGPLSEYLLFTLAAQFATLPVIALHFGRISVSALLANPLVLPAQPAVLVLGGITSVAGMLFQPAGKALMFVAWPFVKYTNAMVTLLAKIKGGVLIIHHEIAIWILVFVACFVVIFFMRKKIAKFFHSKIFAWALLFLACACFTVWSIYAHQADGKLHLHLVRCGEEVTVLLQTPGGKIVILDPRGDVNELTSSLEQTLSPWNFHVDDVLLTDRSSAAILAELTNQITVNQVLLAPSSYRLENNVKPLSLPASVKNENLLPGQRVEIEPRVTITLVSENLQNTALLLEYGNLKVLLPNSVDYAAIKAEDPEALQGLTALVLGPSDVSYIPPRVWQQLAPQTILWEDVSLSPFTNSHSVGQKPDVSFISDGVSAWFNSEN